MLWCIKKRWPRVGGGSVNFYFSGNVHLNVICCLFRREDSTGQQSADHPLFQGGCLSAPKSNKCKLFWKLGSVYVDHSSNDSFIYLFR